MSAIDDKYTQLGGPGGFLGNPTSPETQTPNRDGSYRHYEHGSIYWSLATGAHEVHGAIRDKWAQLGWERSPLGYPATDETATPDHTGTFNHFQHGSIYCTAQTGAHEVHGAIFDKWAALGWERSFLGYPVTDETGTPDGHGRYNHFQNGSIYWTPETGAHEVHGAIRDKWARLGWERSFLGYPTTDETGTPDRHGRYNHFQNGSIYWTPETGAHEVHGGIRNIWSSAGWERSALGYPTSDEGATGVGNGRVSHFQNGSIFWAPDYIVLDYPASGSLPPGQYPSLEIDAQRKQSGHDVTFSGDGFTPHSQVHIYIDNAPGYPHPMELGEIVFADANGHFSVYHLAKCPTPPAPSNQSITTVHAIDPVSHMRALGTTIAYIC